MGAAVPYNHPMRSRVSSVCLLVFVGACAGQVRVASPPTTRPWADPEGRFVVDLPGAPVPRRVQEITAVGTVNFTVYGDTAEPYVYRVTAFVYPVGPTTAFDAAGELRHASGRGVARMGGVMESEAPVAVDGITGLETRFSLTSPDGERAVGVQRMFIGSPPTRYHAFCIAPAHADPAPCDAFVASLRPTPAPRPPMAP